jgi:hypothetical protein
MKYILFSFVFIASNLAYADFFFIQNNNIYSVDSKYSPEKTSFEKARFLKIDVKQNLKNGTNKYKLIGIASPEAFDLIKIPIAPKIIPGEGCAENPMSWLKSSKVLGHIKKKDSAIYIQIPFEATSFGKTEIKCPGNNRFSDNPLQFSTSDKDLTVLICSGDLNYNLLLMKAKTIEAELVITDDCPLNTSLLRPDLSSKTWNCRSKGKIYL